MVNLSPLIPSTDEEETGAVTVTVTFLDTLSFVAFIHVNVYVVV